MWFGEGMDTLYFRKLSQNYSYNELSPSLATFEMLGNSFSLLSAGYDLMKL
jgi:hypothetical protein